MLWIQYLILFNLELNHSFIYLFFCKINKMIKTIIVVIFESRSASGVGTKVVTNYEEPLFLKLHKKGKI